VNIISIKISLKAEAVLMQKQSIFLSNKSVKQGLEQSLKLFLKIWP